MPKKRPVGRPPKKPKEQVFTRSFRCTNDEWDAFLAAAGDKRISEWIRNTLRRAARRK